MVIEFNFDSEKWNLTKVQSEAQQYDNKTVKMLFTGDFPSEFNEYYALIAYGKNLDIIPLEEMENGWGKLLEDENLAFRGCYEAQLKAKNGEKTKHTNICRFFVERSLSGDAQWPVLPTAFTEAMQEVENAKQTAINAKNDAVDAKDDATDAKDAAVEAKNDAEQAKEDLLNAVATEAEVREIITDGNGDD